MDSLITNDYAIPGGFKPCFEPLWHTHLSFFFTKWVTHYTLTTCTHSSLIPLGGPPIICSLCLACSSILILSSSKALLACSSSSKISSFTSKYHPAGQPDQSVLFRTKWCCLTLWVTWSQNRNNILGKTNLGCQWSIPPPFPSVQVPVCCLLCSSVCCQKRGICRWTNTF